MTTGLDHLSDEELIARFRMTAHDPQHDPHINELFRRYYQRVACWCLRFTGSHDSAADLAQEVFISAYRHLDSFRSEARFSTWLYSIARNHSINRARAGAASREVASEDWVLDSSPAPSMDALTRLERQAEAGMLRDLIASELDERERAVVALHYAQDVPLEAITRLLGLTNASGAKAYLVSARRKLAVAARRWQARKGHACATAR